MSTGLVSIATTCLERGQPCTRWPPKANETHIGSQEKGRDCCPPDLSELRDQIDNQAQLTSNGTVARFQPQIASSPDAAILLLVLNLASLSITVARAYCQIKHPPFFQRLFGSRIAHAAAAASAIDRYEDSRTGQ